MYYVYVLRNTAQRLYIGSTGDLELRVRRHQDGGVRWTSSHGPWVLVYQESFLTRSEAVKRERSLKSGRANQELRNEINSAIP